MSLWVDSGAACYGRNKVIACRRVECDVCGELDKCLGFDSSDEEYGSIWICENCTRLAFTKGPRALPVPKGDRK